MTPDKAHKIFNDWKDYAEINDKLMRFFISGIPESFLPYPKEILEEALNIVAKEFFDAGNHKTSEAIQETIAFLSSYTTDEEALSEITNNAVLNDQKLREAILNSLKKSRDSWAAFKEGL